MDEYSQFLESKRIVAQPCGFTVPMEKLNHKLLPFQRDIVHWALKRGKAALWEDCGLGKTFQQLEWAKWVNKHTESPVLLFAPLAVSQQTREEAEKFGIDAKVVERQQDCINGINITNYEKLHHFQPEGWGGIVLDESSILKGFDGKTRKALTDFASGIPYRLCCTATPSPNDYMELGNHAEFLGVMRHVEMLSLFFCHDGGETSKWRLKGHAEDAFWKWLCSWAVAIRKPSDLGYEDGAFRLPKLHIHQVTVESDATPDGYLFPVEAQTLQERQSVRRDSIAERVAECASLVNDSTEPWIVWCNLNTESEAIADAIPDSIEVTGSDSTVEKEHAMRDFVHGSSRVLVSKPTICGFGMNFQHCAHMAFVGLSDSYEQLYQAIRRCWRFGQKREVHCYVITSSAEGAVVRNIERKEKQAMEMMESMVIHMKTEMQREIRGLERQSNEYEEAVARGDRWEVRLGDCVEVVRDIPDESIDFSVFSPPFASLYTYSNSDRDMGNSKDYEQFTKHFGYLVEELVRVTKPGRLVSFHCMNLPTTKERHGYIGVQDFRGDLIRTFIGDDAAEIWRAYWRLRRRAEQAMDDNDESRAGRIMEACVRIEEELRAHPGKQGMIYHSEVCIWKDPVTAMQRTKAIGLLYKQLRKDSTISRQGIPDYLVTMRKPGSNPDPVTKTHEGFPVDRWQRYASPVWMDINPSDTLQKESAREEEDERHICPLQLEVIRRAIELWTNPGDLVLSPFAGIGSEGYVAVEMGRRFIGVELKRSYWEQSVANLKLAENFMEQPTLFSHDEDPPLS